MNYASTLSRALLGLLAALLLALPGAVSASVVPLSIEEMTAVADDIVAVRIKETTVKGYKHLLVTQVDFDVIENFKGSMGAEGSITVLGGRTPAGFAMEAPGTPKFRVGEESVLFLSRPTARLPHAERGRFNSDSPLVQSPQLVGSFQGKLTVVGSEDSGRSGRAAIPANAKITRSVLNRPEPSIAEAPTFADFRAAITESVESAESLRSTGQKRRIIGVYGEFAVPQRSENPVIRSLDPLPGIAYLSNEELDAMNKSIWEAHAAKLGQPAPELEVPRSRGGRTAADPAAVQAQD